MIKKTLALRYGLVLLAIGVATSALAVEDAAAIRGTELLSPLKINLKQALLAGLEKGPENAITVCKEQAPGIASALSTDGVKVGRTSHLLRNPENSSPDWVAPVLQAYLDEGTDRAPTVVPLADGRVGYVEPIMIKPLCLTCHGEALAPGLASRIKEDYPHDEAIGFEVGDLRGVYWAEFPGPATH